MWRIRLLADLEPEVDSEGVDLVAGPFFLGQRLTERQRNLGGEARPRPANAGLEVDDSCGVLVGVPHDVADVAGAVERPSLAVRHVDLVGGAYGGAGRVIDAQHGHHPPEALAGVRLRPPETAEIDAEVPSLQGLVAEQA